MQFKSQKIFRFFRRHNKTSLLIFLFLFGSAVYSAYPERTNAYYKKVRYSYLDRNNLIGFNKAICVKGKQSLAEPLAWFFACPLNTILESKQPLLQKKKFMLQKIKTKSNNFSQAVFGEKSAQ